MALFPNQQIGSPYSANIGKTHTNLVVSEGNAPAERFIVASDNTARPFTYEYGPEGNQTVLIAKGKIVEANGEEKDRETGHTATAIRIAQPGSIRAIGVNHHNVYERRRDAMEGNQPTVITRSYIEVPLFEADDVNTAKLSAEAMNFGAAYGATKALRSGDFVMAGADGNFVAYDGTDFRKVVGQVMNVTRELNPGGLLQYYTGLKNTELENYLKQISATPVAGDDGYPYGAPYTVGAWKPEFLKALGMGKLTGIPFLTDGYFSARKKVTAIITDTTAVEAVRVSGEFTKPDGSVVKTAVAGDVITVPAEIDEAMVFIKLKHKIDPRDHQNVKVTYTDGAAVDPITTTVATRDIHVDVQNNTVVVYLNGGTTANDVTIEVASVVSPQAGVPTEWDYSGSVGAARIQLLR